MRKPTINQRIWQSILAQTEKALAQITKHTGEVFDESVFSMPRPKRITERAISRLQETELKFIQTHVQDIIKNAPAKQVEELKKSVSTHEEYIRHPRMSLGGEEYQPHPLTAEERSARARKAWQTRVSRMTEEQYAEYKKEFVRRTKEARQQREAQMSAEEREARKAKRSAASKKAWETRQSGMTEEEKAQYKKDFVERMRKAKEARELEQQGFVPPPEPEEPIPQQDYEEIFGVPLTPEEAEEYYKEQDNLVSKTDIIDATIDAQLEAMYDNPLCIESRIPPHKALREKAEALHGRQKYYEILDQNAEMVIGLSEEWLFYQFHHRGIEGYYDALKAFNALSNILLGNVMTMEEANDYATDYDTEMQMPD